MKKALLSLTAVLISAGVAFAQQTGTTKINAALVYGSEAGIDDDGSSKGGAGINIGGEYFFTEKISAAPSFTYFFKSEIDLMGGTLSGRASTLNLDGRYYFASSGEAAFYGLAGLTVGFAKVDYESGESGFGRSYSESDSKVGLNLGAGMVYPLSEKLDLNAQVTYNTPLEQLALQVGVALPIK